MTVQSDTLEISALHYRTGEPIRITVDNGLKREGKRIDAKITTENLATTKANSDAKRVIAGWNLE